MTKGCQTRPKLRHRHTGEIEEGDEEDEKTEAVEKACMMVTILSTVAFAPMISSILGHHLDDLLNWVDFNPVQGRQRVSNVNMARVDHSKT